MASLFDDKSARVVPFILERLHAHRKTSSQPFFVGLNGVQGAGKTTLVKTLISTLSSPPHSLPTLAFSIDDLYLPHRDLVALAQRHPENPLLQQRGQPGTHDVALGADLFDALMARRADIAIPSYDKSLHQGKGDRAPVESWSTANQSGLPAVEVVLFEGWCVGFRPLDDAQLVQLWESAKAKLDLQREPQNARENGRLGRQALQHLQVVNDALRRYDVLTDKLNAFIHIDAEDTQYVYEWRLQQETALRAAKGSGMTDEQVLRFVNGYYPAYELFLQKLRSGIFPSRPGCQMRMVIGQDRRVKSHEIL